MSTKEERDRQLEKIRKLLRLASDGRGNIQEAETALRQAQALMRKYSIDEAEAIGQELDGDGEALMRQWAAYGKNVHATRSVKKLPKYVGFLAHGVGVLYDCHTVIANKYDPVTREWLGQFTVFSGYKVDVQVAAWTLEYLCDCVERGFKSFEAALKKADFHALVDLGIETHAQYDQLVNSTKLERRGGFRRMMALTLQRRLLALKKERDAYMQTKSEDSQVEVSRAGALVVLERKIQLVQERFGQAPIRDVKTKLTNPAAQAGYVQGSRTNLNPAPIEGSRQTPVPLLK